MLPLAARALLLHELRGPFVVSRMTHGNQLQTQETSEPATLLLQAMRLAQQHMTSAFTCLRNRRRHVTAAAKIACLLSAGATRTVSEAALCVPKAHPAALPAMHSCTDMFHCGAVPHLMRCEGS